MIVLQLHPRLRCFTDNHQLYYADIDIAILQEMLKNKGIFEIEWVDSSHQLADSLTKAGASSAKLLATLKSGKL